MKGILKIKRISQVLTLLISFILIVFIAENSVKSSVVETNIENSTETEEEDARINEYELTTEEIEDDTEEETFGTLDTLKFTVDVTDTKAEANVYVGNTSTNSSYSGTVKFKFSDRALKALTINITKGNTYVLTTSPMIETETININNKTIEYPVLTVVNYRKANKKDINKLEKIRNKVSNYARCSLDFDSLSLDDLIELGNKNYATWTQKEIKRFKRILKNRGYTEHNSDKKSYVKLRRDLDGSYITENM